MENAHIRAARPADLPRMRLVCQETDNDFSADQAEILCCLYCDYYVEQEPHNSLALVNENDEAVGYLLVAASWPAYQKAYREMYLPRLERLSAAFAEEKRQELESHPALRAAYPAHMHIDILPGWQSQGWGPRMLDAATKTLRAQGCPGLMLGVGEGNTGAIRFYQRTSFARLDTQGTEVLFGLAL